MNLRPTYVREPGRRSGSNVNRRRVKARICWKRVFEKACLIG
jgi:hypothetical protein